MMNCYRPRCMPICSQCPPCPPCPPYPGLLSLLFPDSKTPNGSVPVRPNGKSPEPGEVASKFSVVGGEVHRICQCTRRNGLQDLCPMPGCRGNPNCLSTPLPTCEPAGYFKGNNDNYSIQCCFNPTTNPNFLSQKGNSRFQFVPCPYYK